MYNGWRNLVEHISQFKRKMVVYSQDESLMCRVFPSKLGPMPMRWFDRLKTSSIGSFKKLNQSFYSRFITCSRVPQLLDSLLSMSMRAGESVKAYSERYWEMFNKIDGDFNEVAIKTFKVGLPAEHGLVNLSPVYASLWTRLISIKWSRMTSNKEKGRLRLSLKRGGISGWTDTINNRPRRDYAGQSGSTNIQAVNTMFWELIRQVLEKFKNEPFFKWPNKMVGDPTKHNQNLHCHYHQEQGHTTEDYRNLWDHLDQLVREGKLKSLLHHSSGQGN